MAKNTFLLLIVAGTIIAGCMNSIFTKFQDNQCVRYCDDPDRTKRRNFEQPTIQTMQMFVGELGIYFVYYFYYKSRYSSRGDYTPIGGDNEGRHELTFGQTVVIALPAVFDMLATTLMNVGLVFVPVSIYQMTRGSLVLSVAIMSVIFLKRRIRKLEWVSLLIVTAGVVIVGYSGSRNSQPATESSDASLVGLGIFLILCAVIVQASQFIVEEQILNQMHIVPLKLVYLEGFYGLTILLFGSLALHFIVSLYTPPMDFIDSPYNLVEAISEVISSTEILVSSLCIMVAIATFNFCGMSVTNELSATARSTIDTCRTLLVWLVAMILGWESFHLLQFVGFMVLVFGTLCFNGVLKPEQWPFVPQVLKDPEHENERLIDVVDEPIEHM